MSDIQKSDSPIYDQDTAYFGSCPICRETDGYVNIGRGHWFLCTKHKFFWYAGTDLFSSWEDETEQEQRKIFDELGLDSFRDITDWGPRP